MGLLILLLLRESEIGRGVGVAGIGLVVWGEVVGGGGAVAGVAGHELGVGGCVVGQAVANVGHRPEAVVARGGLRVVVAVCRAIHDALFLLVVLLV